MFSVFIKCYTKQKMCVELSNIAHLEAESYSEIIQLFRQFKREFCDKYCEIVGKCYNDKEYIGEL